MFVGSCFLDCVRKIILIIIKFWIDKWIFGKVGLFCCLYKIYGCCNFLDLIYIMNRLEIIKEVLYIFNDEKNYNIL